MTFTGITSFEHPETGAEITVAVRFKMHPPEPEIGVFGPQPEVIDYAHDGDSLTSDEGAAHDHVDDLPDEWFRAVAEEQAQAAAEDSADHRLQMMKEAAE